MSSAVKITRTDHTSSVLRGLAARCRDAAQSRRLLAIAMVLDGASHKYDLTRASFEIAFPMLRPGGLYIIEDWPWAHYGMELFDEPEWLEQASLTTLVFELTMALGSQPHIIARIETTPHFTVVTKGNIPTSPNFNLTDLIRFGKRKFTPF